MYQNSHQLEGSVILSCVHPILHLQYEMTGQQEAFRQEAD